MAEWLFKKTQMPRGDINFLMEAFASFGHAAGMAPPFADHEDLHRVIDAIPLGDAPWHSFTGEYQGPLPKDNIPSWMTQKYEIWTRDICTLVRNTLDNPDFKEEFHTAPYREYDADNQRYFGDLFSSNWAWRQAVCYYSFFTVVLSY